MLKISLAMSLLILIFSPVSAEESAQLIAFNCRLCHSASSTAIPRLDTLSAEQIERALLDFKTNRRESTVMGRLAKGFTDREIQDVAERIVASKQ